MRDKIYFSYKDASLKLDGSHVRSVHFYLLISLVNYVVQ
jgi:hypothetical protein